MAVSDNPSGAQIRSRTRVPKSVPVAVVRAMPRRPAPRFEYAGVPRPGERRSRTLRRPSSTSCSVRSAYGSVPLRR
ncbi:hypothetical protein ES5_02284 [Dietzia cinnamea P4]|nr:hypothetical protein ES5_02284 [Dietzia cinnamea P4]